MFNFCSFKVHPENVRDSILSKSQSDYSAWQTTTISLFFSSSCTCSEVTGSAKVPTSKLPLPLEISQHNICRHRSGLLCASYSMLPDGTTDLQFEGPSLTTKAQKLSLALSAITAVPMSTSRTRIISSPMSVLVFLIEQMVFSNYATISSCQTRKMMDWLFRSLI